MKIDGTQKIKIDKSELLNSSSALARLPLIAGTVRELPFQNISWQLFESLVFQLVCGEYGVENCTPYGYRGQKQEGLDILVTLPSGECLVYQCKRVQKFTGKEFTKEFDLFFRGEWFEKAAKYYLVSCDFLQDPKFIKAFDAKKRELAGKMQLVKMGAYELNEKLRSRPRLVYDFFSEEYARYFCSQPELDTFLRWQKPQPDKPAYIAPTYYIPRKLSRIGTLENAEENRQVNLFSEVCQRLETDKVSFLIRSNAAYGKTTELEQLVAQVAENLEQMLPLFVRLKHYLPEKHTFDEHLEQLYPNWNGYPQSRTIIVMDGIDEIPIGSFADFTRKISSFFSQYTKVHVVISLRSNFHSSGFVERISENRSFSEFALEELSSGEIDDFVLSKLTTKKETVNFKKLCKQKILDDLLSIPFYLVNLLELYQNKAMGFPKGRRQAMDAIIERRCLNDATRYDLSIQPATLLKMLKELAVVMALKGLNSIGYADMRRTMDYAVDKLRLSSLIQLQPHGLDYRISFVHANFQEYLFALSIVSLDTLKLDEVLFSRYNKNRLKPKFLNVANYLFSMLDRSGKEFTELYNKLFDHNFESLALFEKDKISPEDRLAIFKKIIDKYRGQEFYFLENNPVSAERLWEFVDYRPCAFDEVLGYVDTGNSSTCAAFLDLLQKYPANRLLPDSRAELREVMLSVVAADYDYFIHDRAIDLLLQFEIFDPHALSVIKVCTTIHSKMVRAAVFDYIIKWGKAEEELVYLLESAAVFSNKQERISAGLEMKYVRTIVDLINSNNYRQIMAYLIMNDKSSVAIFSTASYSPALLGNFYAKLGEIYQLGSEYHDAEQLMLDFYGMAELGKREKLGSLIRFYQVGGRVLEGITRLIQMKINGHFAFAWIEAVDMDFLVMIIEKYAKKEIDVRVVCHIRMGLGRVGQRDRQEAFQKMLTTMFPGEFEYEQPDEDYEAVERRKRENDYHLLEDKQLFVKEAERIFAYISSKVGKEKLGVKDLRAAQFSEDMEITEICSSDLVFDELLSIEFHGNLQDLKELFVNKDWEEMIFETVMKWLHYPAEPPIPEKLKGIAEAYYQKVYSPYLDFEKAVWHEEGKEGFTVSNASLIYILFFQQGLIIPTSNQLKGLLLIDFSGSFDTNDQESHLLYPGPLFQLVYQRMDNHRLFTDTVCGHLKNDRVHSNPVMQTFAVIIRYYHLEGMEGQLIRVLEDSSWDSRTKEEILKTYQEIGGEVTDLIPLMNTITKVNTEWHWHLLKILEEDQDCPGTYIDLIGHSLPGNVLGMLSWEGELVCYGMRWGSEQVIEWFFDELRKPRKFDCSDRQVNDWVEAILLGVHDSTSLVDKILELLEIEVGSILDKRFCRRREILHRLLRKLMLRDHSLYIKIMTGYQGLIERKEKDMPEVKDHYLYLYKFEQEYYIESIDNPDEHLIPQVIALII